MLYGILRQEQHSFKLNLNFGLVLQNTEDRSYRYYYPLEYDPILDTPVLIANRADVDRLVEALVTSDLLESEIKLKRPNTKYVYKQVANIMFYVYRTHYILGKVGGGRQLPDYIQNSKSIVNLTHNMKTGRPYEDELCFFRALALNKGAHVQALARPTQELRDKWLSFKGQKEFQTISLEDLDSLEQCFQVNINVFQMISKGVVKTVRISLSRFSSTLYLNLYENHLSWIKNFRRYALKYKCNSCDKMFPEYHKLKRHQSGQCLKATRKSFKGGFYNPPKPLFEQLEEYGFQVPLEVQFFPFFAFFDFESILDKTSSTKEGENTEILSEHRPVSFAVASNVCSEECWHPISESCGLCANFKEAECVVDSDVQSLIKKFIEILRKHQTTSQKYMRERFKDILIPLEERIASVEHKIEKLKQKQKTEERELNKILGNDSTPQKTDSDASLDSFDLEFERLMNGPAVWDKSDSESLWSEEEQDSLSDTPGLSCWQNKTLSLIRIESSLLRQLKVLQEKLTIFTDSLPIFGFNSAKYDLNIILAQLIKGLEIDQQKSPNIIKKNQTYQMIETQEFRFLDISSFPGISYSKFLHMQGLQEKKFFFPYEFLDDPRKLEYDRLPSIEHFYSKLKGRNTLGETEHGINDNYLLVCRAWKENKMKTLTDLLAYYNVLDTLPGISALGKMVKFYKDERGIDMLKCTISVPGIARKLLLDTARKQNAFFYSFNKNEETVYNTFKKSITGGLSQVFNRYSEKDKTCIRSAEGLFVKVIKGWDSNSLYLDCLSRQTPVGRMIHRSDQDMFKPRCEVKQFYSIDYLDYIAQTQVTFIKHKANIGERRIHSFLVDGFYQPIGPGDQPKGVIYEVHGCSVHFHNTDNCPIVSKIKSQKWKDAGPKRYKRTIERENYLRHLGYEVVSI